MRFPSLLIPIMLFFVCPAVHGAPADPAPVEVQQPDGSRIRIVNRGDEFQNWVESEETGHTIVRNTGNGYWEYAEQAPNGQLRHSGIRVLPGGANPPSVAKGLRPPRNNDLAVQMDQTIQDVYEERVAAGSAALQEGASPAPGDWVPAPVSGSRKLLVILVSFADRAIGTTPASWASVIFDTAAKSVAKYYKENSFNALTITPVTHNQSGNPSGIISVSIASNHPNNGGTSNYSSDVAWGNSALQQAAAYLDFNSLDTNGDGRLDTSEVVIYFIAAGYETSANTGLSPSMWAHAWRTTGWGLTAGTKNVQRWALNGEYYDAANAMTMGVIAHELGHQMCGLPDLYDISGHNQAMGAFSLMASGSWGGNSGEIGGTTPTTLDAWSREFLGWGTPVTPNSAGTISLNYAITSPASMYKLVLPTTSTSEYFLVENRQPASWDLGLKRFFGSAWAGGLLVTHIDTTAGTLGSNDINSYVATASSPGHQGVVPVQANTTTCNMLTDGSNCIGAAKTLFYANNKTSWTPVTSPNSNYYSGAATNFSLTSISAPAATMTAGLSLSPTITITSSPAVASNTPQGTFAFTSSDGTASLDCKVDTASYTPCSSPYTTAILADGSHTFSVRATNSSGSSETSYTWTIDTVPPDTTLVSGPTNPTFATSATFSFSSPDASATFQCQLDGSSFSSCYSGNSYNNLTIGSHTFTVRAIDAAGNVDATPVSSTWTIEPCNARIGATCYLTLGAAYTAASSGDTIQAQAVDLEETLPGNRDISITFRGGYDATFSSVIGFTTVHDLTITSGTLDIAGLSM